jgi:two-component system response regulator YesN
MTKEIVVMDSQKREAFWGALKSDHSILFAPTAKQGMTMLSEKVDLVFLGIELPDMNSMEVLWLIKKQYPLTPVIIIASSGTEETSMEAFRRGAMDSLEKPLQADEILHKIKALIDVNNTSQIFQPVSLSKETIQDEHYPDIPFHIVDGVLKVRDFVAQNYSESLTLPAACKMASLSKTYFCRFFKYITGHSLRSYHHMVKIQIANELLRDKKLPVKDVAKQLGYKDSNYFSTIYKKFTGSSPRQHQVYARTLDNEMKI